MKRRAIVIFARSPRAEAVAKSVRHLEPLFRAVCESWLRAASRCHATPLIACDRNDRGAFESVAPDVPRLVIDQRGRSFGERLSAAAADAFSAGFETLLITGIDTAPLHSLAEAFAAAESGSVAIAPSTDGGINAIVLQRRDASILASFAQGDERLLRRCLERFAHRVFLLDASTDIDSARSLRFARREQFWRAYLVTAARPFAVEPAMVRRDLRAARPLRAPPGCVAAGF